MSLALLSQEKSYPISNQHLRGKMETTGKQAVAIAAAIAAYRHEKESLQLSIQSAVQMRRAKPWGLSARQDMMHLRRLYQLRIHRT